MAQGQHGASISAVARPSANEDVEKDLAPESPPVPGREGTPGQEVGLHRLTKAVAVAIRVLPDEERPVLVTAPLVGTECADVRPAAGQQLLPGGVQVRDGKAARAGLGGLVVGLPDET